MRGIVIIVIIVIVVIVVSIFPLSFKARNLSKEIVSIEQRIVQIEQRLDWLETFRVISTAYTICGDETGKEPYMTASGLDLRSLTLEQRERIVAVSKDLELIFPLGSTMIIDGKEYRVEDRMSLEKGFAIDLLMETKEKAREYGRRMVLIRLGKLEEY